MPAKDSKSLSHRMLNIAGVLQYCQKTARSFATPRTSNKFLINVCGSIRWRAVKWTAVGCWACPIRTLRGRLPQQVRWEGFVQVYSTLPCTMSAGSGLVEAAFGTAAPRETSGFARASPFTGSYFRLLMFAPCFYVGVPAVHLVRLSGELRSPVPE